MWLLRSRNRGSSTLADKDVAPDDAAIADRARFPQHGVFPDDRVGSHRNRARGYIGNRGRRKDPAGRVVGELHNDACGAWQRRQQSQPQTCCLHGIYFSPLMAMAMTSPAGVESPQTMLSPHTMFLASST